MWIGIINTTHRNFLFRCGNWNECINGRELGCDVGDRGDILTFGQGRNNMNHLTQLSDDDECAFGMQDD